MQSCTGPPARRVRPKLTPRFRFRPTDPPTGQIISSTGLDRCAPLILIISARHDYLSDRRHRPHFSAYVNHRLTDSAPFHFYPPSTCRLCSRLIFVIVLGSTRNLKNSGVFIEVPILIYNRWNIFMESFSWSRNRLASKPTDKLLCGSHG